MAAGLIPQRKKISMSTADARTLSQSYRIVHLTGCVLGTVLIALSIAFAIGTGPPPMAVRS
jgi:hypothetical protein